MEHVRDLHEYQIESKPKVCSQYFLVLTAILKNKNIL
jgi:hypothetical protein